MSFHELTAEFEEQVVGPQIYLHVSRLVRETARRYRPEVYAERATARGEWTADLLEDLLQSFFSEVLLGQGQLRYAFDVAYDQAAFDAIVRAQLRRHLRQRRRRSVVDNLLDRARELPKSGEASHSEPVPAASEELVRSAACLVAQIPRLSQGHAAPVYGAERAPAVFSTENLKLAVETVTRVFGRAAGLDELRAVFNLALTDLIATDLLPLEGMTMAEAGEGTARAADGLMAAAPLPVPEIAQVDEAIGAIVASLGDRDRVLLLHKLAGASDASLAARLGLSRPTVMKRKLSVLELLREQLDGLSEPAQRAAVDGLYTRLLEFAL